MKRNNVIYWVSTSVFSAFMIFSAVQYLTNPEIAAGFKHLGFRDYFRVELAIMKLIGSIVLVLPLFPARVKEWAYAGFGVTLISASIAHGSSGDPVVAVVMPLVFLVILTISNLMLRRVSFAKSSWFAGLTSGKRHANTQNA